MNLNILLTLNIVIQSLLAFGAFTIIPFSIFYNHNIGPIRIVCLCIGVMSFVTSMIMNILSVGQFNIVTQTFHVSWILAIADLTAKSIMLMALWGFELIEWKKGPYKRYNGNIYKNRSKKEGDQYRTRAEKEGDKYRRRAEEEGDKYRSRAEKESNEKEK